jgi:glycosidase
MGHRRALIIGFAMASVCASLTAQPAPPRPGPPSWAKDAIWYSVVIDRFRNGDPRNDPKATDLRGAFPGDPGREWQVAPWTSSWYSLLAAERASGRDFYAAVYTRRYGGDLAGLIERLDHLQALGVNTLLLTPVFEAPSAIKRDPTFLHHVDNNFGPDPDGDRLIWATENPGDPSTWKWSGADRLFLRLVQECHRRQLRVVVELGVPYVGQTFWAFRDVRARGSASKFASWFGVGRFDDPKTPVDEMEYAGHLGARELPELRKEGDGLSAGPNEHLRLVLKRWSDPGGDGDASDGVDGFLFAGAERLGLSYWRELRAYVLALNPEAIVLGGFGLEDEARTRPADPSTALTRGAFDAAPNHAFAAAARAFFLDRKGPPSPAEFDSLLLRVRELAPVETGLALLLPLDGPDGERVASRAVNPDREPGVSTSPRDNPAYEVRAPRAEEAKRLRLLATFHFASVGAPLLSYGTEAGMWGASDPDALRPMIWRELRYDEDAATPAGTSRKGDPVRFDEDLFKHFQALARARAAQPALRGGAVEPLLAEEGRRLYAFARVLENERVVAAFNLTDKEHTVDLPFPGGAEPRDLLLGRRLKQRDGKVTMVLPPLSGTLVGVEPARPK